WLPVAIGVLNESFNEENGMVNSTMKIVRGKITERYKDFIDWLYTPMGKVINNNMNVEEVEKMKLG
ncbi:MAG TPA: long-chain fatty acid--CoA ligase, partial [Bacteroidales bacterium]|nr:long-chain fatty acid--CoA ligase [Bacteroidales bacterium]